MKNIVRDQTLVAVAWLLLTLAMFFRVLRDHSQHTVNNFCALKRRQNRTAVKHKAYNTNM